jgi:D-sedoheptulose 7-phosphate isomerase
VKETINHRIFQCAELISDLVELAPYIEQAAQCMIETIEQGGKIMFCGNGGSAADSQHLAAELVNRFLINRAPLPGIALTTDTSVITAIGNDFDFSEIYSKQIEAIGKRGDSLVAITTSGKSENILEALRIADGNDINTIVLTGQNGKFLFDEDKADFVIVVPSTDTPRIQECHILIGHILCELVEQSFFGENKGD